MIINDDNSIDCWLAGTLGYGGEADFCLIRGRKKLFSIVVTVCCFLAVDFPPQNGYNAITVN